MGDGRHDHGVALLKPGDDCLVRRKCAELDPNKVFATVHPIETEADFGNKPLSLIQKAITCCIIELGGSATGEEILAFVRYFWPDIVKQGERLYKGIPDKRILHVALSNKRCGTRLFVPSRIDSTRYVINRCESGGDVASITKEEEDVMEIMEEEEESLEQIDAEMVFDQRILSTIASSKRGVKMETLITMCHGFEDEDGSFRHLNVRHRIRACLLLLKMQKSVRYDPKTGRWHIQDNIE